MVRYRRATFNRSTHNTHTNTRSGKFDRFRRATFCRVTHRGTENRATNTLGGKVLTKTRLTSFSFSSSISRRAAMQFRVSRNAFLCACSIRLCMKTPATLTQKNTITFAVACNKTRISYNVKNIILVPVCSVTCIKLYKASRRLT